jgi:hypothetical protein
MFAELPRLLRRAVICEVIAILLLLASMFCSKAIPYLLTIGLGAGFLMLGLLFTVMTLIRAMRANTNE